MIPLVPLRLKPRGFKILPTKARFLGMTRRSSPWMMPSPFLRTRQAQEQKHGHEQGQGLSQCFSCYLLESGRKKSTSLRMYCLRLDSVCCLKRRSAPNVFNFIRHNCKPGIFERICLSKYLLCRLFRLYEWGEIYLKFRFFIGRSSFTFSLYMERTLRRKCAIFNQTEAGWQKYVFTFTFSFFCAARILSCSLRRGMTAPLSRPE